jgi:hypothetical protein
MLSVILANFLVRKIRELVSQTHIVQSRVRHSAALWQMKHLTRRRQRPSITSGGTRFLQNILPFKAVTGGLLRSGRAHPQYAPSLALAAALSCRRRRNSTAMDVQAAAAARCDRSLTGNASLISTRLANRWLVNRSNARSHGPCVPGDPI